MIAREQIKAARALLDWSQKDLAEKSGMSEPTIKLIETGKVNSKPDTLQQIQQTLEIAGIEFLPQKGVRFKDDLLTVIEKQNENDNVYTKLMDDIFYTTRGKYSDILFSFVDQSISPPEVISKQKLIRENGSTMRFLVRYEDKVLLYPSNEYRYLPKGYYLNNPTVIYGNKFAVAVIDSEGRGIKKVIIIHDKDIAAIKRNEFEIIWQYGETVKK